ncbi:MAG: chalcone isomerase family protein [Xanthomonadaceae bacterium]|nr:chalcone isomerase family protein [Xanthomonadaceae bacterium]
MNKNVFAVSFALSLLINTTFASISEKRVIEDVLITDSLKVESDGKPLTLPLLGAGIRKKNIAFLKFKVYVASIFAKNKKSWENEEEPIAIQLHFLRSIPIGKVIDSFSNSLKMNDVNLDNPEMKKIFEIVKKNGDIKDQQALTILGTRGKNDELTFTLSSGESEKIIGSKGLVRDFFTIWFGKSEDSGLEKLMEQVLKENE